MAAAVQPVPPSGRLFFAALAALLATLWFLPGDWTAKLFYLRPMVRDGEIWRLVTGQLVHLEARHLLWNLAGLGLVALGFGRRLAATDWLAVTAAAAVAAGMGLLAARPEAPIAAGFSGVLHGLFAAAGLAEMRRGSTEAGLALLILLTLKLFGEYLTGPVLDGGMTVEADFGGAAAGLAAEWLCARRRRRRE